jgi:hypothetical protein
MEITALPRSFSTPAHDSTQPPQFAFRFPCPPPVLSFVARAEDPPPIRLIRLAPYPLPPASSSPAAGSPFQGSLVQPQSQLPAHLGRKLGVVPLSGLLPAREPTATDQHRRASLYRAPRLRPTHLPVDGKHGLTGMTATTSSACPPLCSLILQYR